MPSTKEIKSHMKSVRDTQKITNAMYLIASTKLRKARLGLDGTRPYFEALRTEIKRVFKFAGDIESDYFEAKEGHVERAGEVGVLVITADKGLSGAYNINIIKEALGLLERHPGADLFVVGEVGRHYFEERQIPIEKTFLYTAQNPTVDRAREIAWTLLDRFGKDDLRSIYVIYTDMKNSLVSETRVERLLPFYREEFASEVEHDEQEFEFNPGMKEVLDTIMPNYLIGYIYSTLVDSFCAEQNARMSAMSSANDNAQKLLDELTIQYNRVRQAAITREITEVSAGARAQRRKKMVSQGPVREERVSQGPVREERVSQGPVREERVSQGQAPEST